jgi:hypothetical protein
VKDLVSAFAENPKLPKMLWRKEMTLRPPDHPRRDRSYGEVFAGAPEVSDANIFGGNVDQLDAGRERALHGSDDD